MSNGIPTDPVQAMLAQTSLQKNLFVATSRYFGIDMQTLRTSDGTAIIYLKRRFVPSPNSFQLLQLHSVVQGDRWDNIAGKLLGDPELFWRLADANGAMKPEALVSTAGKKLKITLPRGITGNSL